MDSRKDRIGVFPQWLWTQGIDFLNSLTGVGQGEAAVGVESGLKNHPRHLGRELAQQGIAGFGAGFFHLQPAIFVHHQQGQLQDQGAHEDGDRRRQPVFLPDIPGGELGGDIEGGLAEGFQQFSDRRVVQGDGKAVDTDGLRHIAFQRELQQGGGHDVGRLFAHMGHGQQRPFRVEAGGEGQGKVGEVLVVDNAQLTGANLPFPNEHLDDSGPHHGRIRLAAQQGLDGSIVGHAGLQDLGVSVEVDPLAQTFEILQHESAEGFAARRGDPAADEIAERVDVAVFRQGDDSAAEGANRFAVLGVDECDQRRRDGVAVGELDIVGGRGQDEVDFVAVDGLDHLF